MDEEKQQDTGWQCMENKAGNSLHVETGRATNQFGLVYAQGSNQWLGFYLSPREKLLAETTSGYWEKGACPQ